ncbi:hypothetical protein DBB34_03380 [Sphaerisporangium cinnabarinum]|nr:hypothetical protein [Sphaerisporangium cinnabarinum]PTU57588.1 hypothetical protein DBB34_03380 [Sphaerisporangium cinnabarinum]
MTTDTRNSMAKALGAFRSQLIDEGFTPETAEGLVVIAANELVDHRGQTTLLPDVAEEGDR